MFLPKTVHSSLLRIGLLYIYVKMVSMKILYIKLIIESIIILIVNQYCWFNITIKLIKTIIEEKLIFFINKSAHFFIESVITLMKKIVR